MRASWIFSTNDVIANLGVIISGALVALVGNRYPDLFVGTLISIIVIRGGIKILHKIPTKSRVCQLRLTHMSLLRVKAQQSDCQNLDLTKKVWSV